MFETASGVIVWLTEILASSLLMVSGVGTTLGRNFSALYVWKVWAIRSVFRAFFFMSEAKLFSRRIAMGVWASILGDWIFVALLPVTEFEIVFIPELAL